MTPHKRAPTARVVHENVQAAEHRERLRSDCAHSLARGNVAGNKRHLRGGIIVARACGDYDFGAGIEKALRDSRAVAPRASGD